LGFCNEYTYTSQQYAKDRLFGMGIVDPYCIDYMSVVERLIDTMKFKGLKFEISEGFGLSGYHKGLNLEDENFMAIWTYLNEKEKNVSLDLGTFGEPSLQVEEVSRIAKRFDKITFTIEHLFFPKPNIQAAFTTALNQLKSLQNINFSVASIPVSTSPEAYPFDKACDYVKRAKSIVGIDRLMWGTDVPSVLNYASYQALKYYLIDGNVVKDNEIEKIYYNNAKRVYKL